MKVYILISLQKQNVLVLSPSDTYQKMIAVNRNSSIPLSIFSSFHSKARHMYLLDASL